MSSEGRTQSYLWGIWYQPGRTIQELQVNGAGHGAALLVVGAFGLLNGARFYMGSEEKSALWLLFGFFFGVGMLYLMAQLTRNFSRWFGGRAECRIVRVGLGLALLPWTVLSGLLLYLLASGLDAERLQAFGTVMMAGFLYGFVILLLALRTALGVSPLRTFASLMLAGMVAFFSITFVLSFFIQV
jgi:hypothetical protein